MENKSISDDLISVPDKSRMGKKEEERFRQLFKDIECYILRLHDYSVSGIMSKNPGDFIIVSNGRSYLFEVKKMSSNTSFSLDLIGYGQITGLRQHYEKGYGESYVVLFTTTGVYFLPIYRLLEFIEKNERKSIPIEYIREYSESITTLIKRMKL